MFARGMVLAAVAKWYEMGGISQAKGAEICAVSRAAFLGILSRHSVASPVISDACIQVAPV